MDEVLAQAERDAETAEELFWTGGARRIRALAAEVRALRAKLEVLDENRHRWFVDAETDYHSFYRIHGVEKRFHHIAELADALAALSARGGEDAG